jgi:transitional endoplasmic reticulum ATPase
LLANYSRSDVSGAERKDEDDTATAILKKKKKPNQLMYVKSVAPDLLWTTG